MSDGILDASAMVRLNSALSYAFLSHQLRAANKSLPDSPKPGGGDNLHAGVVDVHCTSTLKSRCVTRADWLSAGLFMFDEIVDASAMV